MVMAGLTVDPIYQTAPDGRAVREDDEFPDIEGYSDGEAETHAERIARLRASKILADPDAEAVADVDSDGEPVPANPNEKRYRLEDLDSSDSGSDGGSGSDEPEGGYVHESLLAKRGDHQEKRASGDGTDGGERKSSAGGRQRQRKRAKKGGAGGGGDDDARPKRKGKPGKRQREAMKAAREAEAAVGPRTSPRTPARGRTGPSARRRRRRRRREGRVRTTSPRMTSRRGADVGPGEGAMKALAGGGRGEVEDAVEVAGEDAGEDAVEDAGVGGSARYW